MGSQQEKILLKQDLNLKSQMQSPRDSCLVSRVLKDLDILVTFLPPNKCSSLTWFHCWCAARLDRCLRTLPPLTSCFLYHSLSFIITASVNCLSAASIGNSCPVLCCLTSEVLWNRKQRIHNHFTFVSFMLPKTVPYRWHCQNKVPVWDVFWTFRTQISQLF